MKDVAEFICCLVFLCAGLVGCSDRSFELKNLNQIDIDEPQSPSMDWIMRQLTESTEANGFASAFTPAPLPDGRVVYLESTLVDGNDVYKHWILDPDTNEREQLNSDRASVSRNSYPTALGDDRIVYNGWGSEVVDDDEIDPGGIWVINLKNHRRKKIFNFYSDFYQQTGFNPLATTPDGKVIFSEEVGEVEPTTELWMIDPDTMHRSLLVSSVDGLPHHGLSAYDPAVLPDGRIVFITDRPGIGIWEFWMIDPKTKEWEQLTDHREGRGNIRVSSPGAMPDGRIVYATDISKEWKFEFWMMNPDTKEREQLISRQELGELSHISMPKSLPDGRIVFQSNMSDDKTTQLWILEPDTGEGGG